MTLREKTIDFLSRGEYRQTIADYRQRIDSLKEATDYMVERAQEDALWLRAGAQDQAQYQMPPRDQIINQARWAFENDPMIRRGVWAHTEFAVGQGISLRPKRKPGEDPATGFEVLDAFWKDRHNREAVLSPSRQQEISNSILIDGEVFLALYVDAAKRVQVRRYPTLSIINIIEHPDDSGRVLYYVASITDKTFDPREGRYLSDSRTSIRYYRAIGNDDPSLDPLVDVIPPEMVEPNAYMIHVSRNRVRGCGFGLSDVFCAMRWARAAKKIAEDQATISRATAALMTVLSAQGDDNTLQNLQRSIQSVTERGGPMVPTAGSMNIVPEGTNLSVSRAGTQASDAWQNSRLMRVPLAASFGLALHYMGDPENANLATATSMEAPILKHLLTYQGQLLGMFGEVLDFVLRVNGLTEDDVPYVVSGPDIIQSDNTAAVTALSDAATNEALTPDQISQKYLEVLQFNDAAEELDSVIEWRQAKTEAAPAAVEQPPQTAADPNMISNTEAQNGLAA